MATSGLQKAAALLMSLDPQVAAQLLQSARPVTVTRIAAELALLRQSESQAPAEAAREFLELLRGNQSGDDPVRRLLEIALGDRAPAAMKEVDELIQRRDPFSQIRSASPHELSEVLRDESAQVVCLVLSELPPRKSTELIERLDDALRSEAVRMMAAGHDLSGAMRLRVARSVRARLDEMARKAEQTGGPVVDDGMTPRQRHCRKVACVIRPLATEVRSALMESLTQRSPEVATEIVQMMVLWEDLTIVNDRAVQEALKALDSRKLALAMVGADEATIAKVRANISERAGAMLDEESSLLSDPKPADINHSREMILNALSEINQRGELTFQET